MAFSTPAVQARQGRGAPVRSTVAPRHCVQCPVLARESGREAVHVLRCGRLASRRLHSTRLETRTKECSRCASSSGVETRRCTMKVKTGRVARRGESRLGGASSTDPLPRRGGIRVRALLLRPERW